MATPRFNIPPPPRRRTTDRPATDAIVLELFPAGARGHTCLLVKEPPAAAAVKSRRPMPAPEAFAQAESIELSGEAIHAVLEPVEEVDALGPVRGALIGLLIGAGFWLIACCLVARSP